MKSNYKRLGDYIRQVDVRNKGLITSNLLGINIDKFFMSSVANIIGTDLSNYKLITENQFAFNPMHVGRDERIPIALYLENKKAIVSPAYFVFEIIGDELLSKYLMLWFRRQEFDRECWFYTDASVRGGITWEDFCEMRIPVPPIEEQQKIVDAYQTIEHRIALKKKINENLEKQAKAIFREFIDTSSNIQTYQMNELFNIRYGKGLATSDLQEKGYFVFGSNGLIGRYTQYMYEKEQITVSCRGASSGKVNISLPRSFITSNSLILECKKPNQYEFLKAFCKIFSFKEYVTGSAQPQLTIDSLLNVSVSLPNLSNIDEVCSKLKTISAAIQINTLESISFIDSRELLLNMVLHY